MKIAAIHQNFIMPTKGTELAGAFDIYMPEPGIATLSPRFYSLGFAAAVPEGHVALILPRSGVGTKFGLELHNTCGVIDSDYRGEWMASIKTKTAIHSWQAGDRILQFLVVPVADVHLLQVEVDQLPKSSRGVGGLGSTGA